MPEKQQEKPLESIVKDPSSLKDTSFEVSLRPLTLQEYIGQQPIKQNLSVFIQAARGRKEPLGHVLLYGPPGLGKTTLAHIIGREMNVNVRTTSGPAIERAGDLAAILTNLQSHDVLFIDEIHRLPRIVEEVLYPAMEDRAIDVVLGKGPGARSVRLELPHVTIIGATTRLSLLSSPLRDRFPHVFRLNFYTPEEMESIVKRSSRILSVNVDHASVSEIARRSRSTPRIANNLLRAIRDYAEVQNNGHITTQLCQHALGHLDIDSRGLDGMDRRVLQTIIEQFSGGPVGIGTLSAAISEEQETIEDVVEPFLIQCGLLQRTPRGRIATPQTYHHLGKLPPQGSFFDLAHP
ncbi:MAG: Holliday junction branch migration DNA helicase RuvB [Candidatus Kerfeldbacteria bacterium]|nr:Holliday junction branch migration DNA helicase RuvB [Candidatus Kerfeldbacteria bacterium]